MKCDRVNDLFGDLHDGQLDGTLAETVRHHLGNCPDCREDFKWYGFTVQALANLETVSPPANFLAQVRARCETAESFWSWYSFRETFSHLPYLPLPVGVTAAVVLGMFAFGLYNYAPTPIVQSIASTRSVQTEEAGVSKVAATAPWDAGHADGSQMPSKSMMARSQEPSPSSPTVRMNPFSTMSPSMEAGRGFTGRALPAVQDRVGTDKLLVESPSIDQAVESLKRILPGIQGRLLEERRPSDAGGTVLAVVIPPQAYPHLTTELINHGAVAVGPNSQSSSASQPGGDAGKVVLYIHFVNSR